MIISRYWEKADAVSLCLYIVSYEISVCPICGEVLVVIGSRKRKVIESGNNARTLIIRRLRCTSCRTIHHELPDMVMPYKRHCADTVEKIISGETKDLICYESTMRRLRAWWSACILYFESVLASLRAKYGVVFTVGSAPREVVRAVVNANLWTHTRSVFSP